MRSGIASLLLFCAFSSARGAEAEPGKAWLDKLYDRVADDLRAGRPLVVQAHVALCDNSIIRCGGHGQGDGDDLDRNLYWATSGGMRGWFERRGSGWTLAHRERHDGEAVMDIDVWKRTQSPSEGWRRRGVTRPFDVYVVAFAWRGKAIDDAVQAYVDDLYGGAPRTVSLDDGTRLQAGGAAQVVTYVGHDRWMDYVAFDWSAAERKQKKGAPPKGTIAVACDTHALLAAVPSWQRVPLLFTHDFLFAGSHAFEGALRAFLDGKSLAQIRVAGARAYADGQGKSFEHVQSAFINPSDKRWGVRPRD